MTSFILWEKKEVKLSFPEGRATQNTDCIHPCEEANTLKNSPAPCPTSVTLSLAQAQLLATVSIPIQHLSGWYLLWGAKGSTCDMIQILSILMMLVASKNISFGGYLTTKP